MHISAVAITDKNGRIVAGGVPVKASAEAASFIDSVTERKIVVVGKRAALEIGRGLPGRETLVLSTAERLAIQGMVHIQSIEAAITRARRSPSNELVVLGGGRTYRAFLPYCQTVHKLVVDARPGIVDIAVSDRTVSFPELDEAEWMLTGCRRAGSAVEQTYWRRSAPELP